jgi:CRP-like cAMP-binding protein
MNAMSRIRVAPGEVVIRQGAPGDKFYICEKGNLAIIVGHEQVGRIEVCFL